MTVDRRRFGNCSKTGPTTMIADDRIVAERLREESQRLAMDLAGVHGQLTAVTTQIAAAEDRARSAEARLEPRRMAGFTLPARR